MKSFHVVLFEQMVFNKAVQDWARIYCILLWPLCVDTTGKGKLVVHARNLKRTTKMDKE